MKGGTVSERLKEAFEMQDDYPSVALWAQRIGVKKTTVDGWFRNAAQPRAHIPEYREAVRIAAELANVSEMDIWGTDKLPQLAVSEDRAAYSPLQQMALDAIAVVTDPSAPYVAKRAARAMLIEIARADEE